MNSEKLNTYRLLLLQRKKDIETEMTIIAEKSSDGNGYEPKYNQIGESMDDNIHEVENFEVNLSLEETLTSTLNDINNALERVEQGTYGICENCGQDIPEDRLKAIPRATKCIVCEAKA